MTGTARDMRGPLAVPGFGHDLGMDDGPAPNEGFLGLEWLWRDCKWRFGGVGYVGSRRNEDALYRVLRGKIVRAAETMRATGCGIWWRQRARTVEQRKLRGL
jgi:hypothetical protein